MPGGARAAGHRLRDVQSIVSQYVVREPHALRVIGGVVGLLRRPSSHQGEVVLPPERVMQRRRVLREPGDRRAVVDVRLSLVERGLQQARRVLLLEKVVGGVRQARAQGESPRHVEFAEQRADAVAPRRLVLPQVDDRQRVVVGAGEERPAEVAVRVVHGNGRREAQGLHRDRPPGRAVAVVDASVVRHGAAVGGACPEAEPRAHVLIEIEAQRSARDVRAEQHPLLVVPVGREHEPRVFGGAADPQLVILDRRGSVGHVLPIGGLEPGQRVERDAGVVRRVPHVEQRELVRVQHIDVLGDVLHADIRGVIEVDRPASALGRHHDDAVAAPSAVDRGGGSVLQDVKRLDVVGIDEAEIRADDAVDHDQRRVARREGIAAAHADAQLRIGLRVGGLDLHAGNASRERLLRSLDGIRLDLRPVDRRGRAGEVLLAHRAIADGHDRVQLDGTRGEPEIESDPFGSAQHHRCVGGRIAQGLDPQVVGARRQSAERVPALRVGLDPDPGLDHLDDRAIQEDLGVLGAHDTGDRARRVLGGGSRRHEHGSATNEADTRRSHRHGSREVWRRETTHVPRARTLRGQVRAMLTGNGCCVRSTVLDETPWHPRRKFTTGSS